MWAAGGRRYTVLMYLNDHFVGGATTFPSIRKRYQPVKGAALFFNNLYPEEGGPDANISVASKHQGDPVILGEKWAVNCWVREHPWTPVLAAIERSGSSIGISIRNDTLLFDDQ